jgi:hypothetical protein
MSAQLRKGIEEFNSQYYFEAHDTWEELWREASGPERLFLQGLIQVAVGMYHREHGNLRGAEGQLSKALSKLALYLPVYQGILTEELTKKVRECLDDLLAVPGKNSPAWKPKFVPRISFFGSNERMASELKTEDDSHVNNDHRGVHQLRRM